MPGVRFFVVPVVALLAACGGQAPERGDDGREAEGEVLGGSISDEMLPLDQLRSQSPTLRGTDGSVGDSTDEDEAEGANSDEAAGEGEGQPANPSPAGEEPPAGE